MKLLSSFIFFLLFTTNAFAGSPGEQVFVETRKCVMENNAPYCHSIMTSNSMSIFDRFASYKLMPCLPTDFTYVGEASAKGHITVKIRTPAGNGVVYILRLVFTDTPSGIKLDIPASLERGLGADWQDKLQMSEQLYLMMRQNMQGKLTCDMLTNLITPN